MGMSRPESDMKAAVVGSDGAALPLLDPRVFGEFRFSAPAPGGDGAVLLHGSALETFDPERFRAPEQG